jgi:4-hydroxymandelate oxidase
VSDTRGAGFASLGELEEAAARVVAPETWLYVQSGAVGEDAVRANRDAFRRRTLRPRVLADVSTIDLTTTLLDSPAAAPIFICPMARHGLLTPDGELATARASARAQLLATYSTLSSRSLEEISSAAPTGVRWFQLYLQSDFPRSRELVERAERSGYSALILTVDTPLLGVRDRLAATPFVLDPDHALGNGPSLRAPARAPSGGTGRYTLRGESAATWTVLDDLQSITRLPVVVKGVLTGEDARRAVAHGARAVIVSNHGGRQLDAAEAALDRLPEVVRAVGSEVEVYFDSGVRRASDALIALALGARAVGLGRPVLWSLAVGGEAGVDRFLSLFAQELATTMALTGRRRIGEIDRTLLGELRW